jgi:hypothetical protein
MAQLQVHKVFGALPGTPVDNSLYFVKTLQNDLRIFVTESSGNVAREIVVGESNPLEEEIFQTSHGFSVGEVLKTSSVAGEYELAQADSAANAEVVGIVSEVVDVDTYKIQIGGNLTAGVPSGSHGDVVFLSPTVAGGTTNY